MASKLGGIGRRDFALGCFAVLTAACGKVPAGNAKAHKGLWPQFRERFVLPAGRVIDNGNGNISHSEGQGYGMLLACLNGDRRTFDSLAQWTATTLLRHDVALHAWKYDPRDVNPVADPNNATDGDILIAWALARAAKQWKVAEYGLASRDIRKAIRSRLVVERAGSAVLLPGLQGFNQDGRVVVNPSYYIWSALDAFAALDGENVWGPVIDDGVKLLTAARFGPLALPVDWFEMDAAGKLAPARDKPPRFGFDAIRVPLYAAAARRMAIAETAVAWWNGLAKSGKAIPAWIDVMSGETAPFTLSAGGMAVVSRAMGTAQPDGLAEDYYAAILQLLAHDLV
ncbi:endoglucanase [Novosphingobium hassiacum]|uniref:cellulase n=1 Tax=Novosphingobium hassiacum TaxID=173676 RepID=A0A7W6EV72_9SPHN|nr:glycosyl hydrolase family 8 [Novosphingobium hassiacum]MBB3859983.1 endoglucanase [Novosphingobium hassiacum]